MEFLEHPWVKVVWRVGLLEDTKGMTRKGSILFPPVGEENAWGEVRGAYDREDLCFFFAE